MAVIMDVTATIAKPKYLGRVIDAVELATCHRARLPGGQEVTSRLDGVNHAADFVDGAGGETFAVLYVHYRSGGVQWVANLYGDALSGTRQDPALEIAEACAHGYSVPLYDYRVG